MAASPGLPPSEDPNKFCDKCGAPASWADDLTSTWSWNKSLRHPHVTYFETPHMWPVGYILSSPYSPFCLEGNLPIINWRDAFEDLIAYESNGQLINTQSRDKEAEVAKRIRFENVHNSVSFINQQLKLDARGMTSMKEYRACAARANRPNIVSFIDNDGIPSWEKSTKDTVVKGQRMITDLEKHKNKPASWFKRRGEWIASLISSGALPGWTASLHDSADGALMDLRKTVKPPEGNARISITEAELDQLFDRGIPPVDGDPEWTTRDGKYPDAVLLPLPDLDTGSSHTELRLPTMRPSIIEQITKSEITRLSNGTLTTKVLLKNLFTNGKVEEKEIVDDAPRVLEEVDKAREAIFERQNVIVAATQDKQYQFQHESLRQLQELLDSELD